MSRKAQGRARWVLPAVVDPPGRVCFQILVPDEPQHIAAFYGALYDLAKPYNWGNDDAHTAIAVGAVWNEIFFRLRRNNCAKENGIGTDEGPDYMIRQNPDNPCLLESSVNGTTWCSFADLSKCLKANPAQPSPAGDGPAPGETQQHCLTLNGNGKTLLPIGVSGGDVITLSDITGGWNDGSSAWYCGDGSGYILGACVDFCGTDGSDPLPAACHMRIVAEIDGVFYDTATPIIVPSTVTDATCVFQANDSDLADNFGAVNFCANVANHTQESFTHHFDFREGFQGWQPRNTGHTPFPVFTPGVGIQQTNPAGIPGQGLFEIGLNMPGVYSGLVVRMVGTMDDNAGGEHGIYNIGAPFVWDGQTESFTTNDVPNIDLTANFTLTSEALKFNANVGTIGDTNTITDAYISGPGADPFL